MLMHLCIINTDTIRFDTVQHIMLSLLLLAINQPLSSSPSSIQTHSFLYEKNIVLPKIPHVVTHYAKRTALSSFYNMHAFQWPSLQYQSTEWNKKRY